MSPSRSNLFKWAVTILGPPDTLYEGGFFNAVLEFPKDYPQSPPECRFLSEMWHPNGAGSQAGSACSLARRALSASQPATRSYNSPRRPLAS